MAEKYLRPKDICRIFGISKATVSKWVKDKIITAYKIDGLRGYFFKEEEIGSLLRVV